MKLNELPVGAKFRILSEDSPDYQKLATPAGLEGIYALGLGTNNLRVFHRSGIHCPEVAWIDKPVLTFGDIKPGEKFMWHDRVYMKVDIDPYKCLDTKVGSFAAKLQKILREAYSDGQAVEISTGKLFNFSDDTEVERA